MRFHFRDGQGPSAGRSLLLIAIIPSLQFWGTKLISFLWGYCGWHIEESFLDDKSNGFELERSQIRDAKMLERLCFVLAIATLYLTA